VHGNKCLPVRISDPYVIKSLAKTKKQENQEIWRKSMEGIALMPSFFA
jgi:hypothetical protein